MKYLTSKLPITDMFAFAEGGCTTKMVTDIHKVLTYLQGQIELMSLFLSKVL